MTHDLLAFLVVVGLGSVWLILAFLLLRGEANR